MTEQAIRFDDGAAYENFMGIWSQKVGAAFLDWLAPAQGQRWLDVGCGNGAFSEMIVQRLQPARLDGIDPSLAQIAYAQGRAGTQGGHFQVGDAMALPYADNSVDDAVMALVIFFVPDPALGVAEMARVTRSGGVVSAYAWDLIGGGFPYAMMLDAFRALGMEPPMPPQAAVATPAGLRGLWQGAGLTNIQTTTINVERVFSSFEDFWSTALLGPIIAPVITAMQPAELEKMQAMVRESLSFDAQGQVICKAWSYAVSGVVA